MDNVDIVKQCHRVREVGGGRGALALISSRTRRYSSKSPQITNKSEAAPRGSVCLCMYKCVHGRAFVSGRGVVQSPVLQRPAAERDAAVDGDEAQDRNRQPATSKAACCFQDSCQACQREAPGFPVLTGVGALSPSNLPPQPQQETTWAASSPVIGWSQGRG
jgi:hypothetical protein